MADKAHVWTDAQIAEMEKELKKYYQDSYNEIAKEMREILSKMNLSKNMTASELYAEARKYERLETLENQLTESLKSVNSDSIVKRMVDDGVSEHEIDIKHPQISSVFLQIFSCGCLMSISCSLTPSSTILLTMLS